MNIQISIHDLKKDGKLSLMHCIQEKQVPQAYYAVYEWMT